MGVARLEVLRGKVFPRKGKTLLKFVTREVACGNQVAMLPEAEVMVGAARVAIPTLLRQFVRPGMISTWRLLS